jgi:Rrf2 family protein
LASILKISEAASLALHAMVLLANNQDGPMTTKEIAGRLRVSSNHLSKVLQRLVRFSLVESSRGRGGGYELARPAHRLTLGDIYEAIDGPLKAVHCLLGEPVCRKKKCILSDLLKTLNEETRKYLFNTKLSDMTGVRLGCG